MNDWIELLTAFGGFLGGGWLFNIYSAKPKKTSIELENVGKAMEEMQNVIQTMKETSRDYRESTARTIGSLEAKINSLEQNIVRKDEIIYAAYDCPFPRKTSECIVLRTFKKCQDCTIETEIVEENGNNKETD